MTKTKLLGLALGLAFLASTASAESPCVECRKAALLRVQGCMASAKTEAAKSECTKLGQELTKACNQGACAK